MKKNWTKRDPIKNYFPVPNEIYSLGLSSDAISIYGYLLSREDRKTYQCLVSYRMISEAIGKCVTTVRKYVMELGERQLIRTEHTSVVAKDGRNLNGRLRYAWPECAGGEQHQRPYQLQGSAGLPEVGVIHVSV